MINKYLARTLVFLGLFGVTTGITIGVSHSVNQKSESESSEPVNKTDTQKFISKLANFGNLEGTVDLTACINDFDLSADGNVFVSMETMSSFSVKAELDVEMSESTYPIVLTYIDDTLFFDYDELFIKVKKDDFSLIIDALKEIGIELKIPEVFKNISATELLFNLSKMSSQIEGSQIVYTCNLIKDLAPVIFTSDIEHNLTGVSVCDLEVETIKASLNAKTKVLGKGHNKITNPEKAGQEYIDIGEWLK